MTTQTVRSIASKLLDFDPDNPRFFRLNDASSVESVINEMLDDESVQDLMLSIGQKGYFEGEPLLVVASKNGRYIVVEGNRRLAAVKLLNGEIAPPTRRTASISAIRTDTAVPPPVELPCLEYPARRDVLRYLGYRHITGIKEWDSLSKAKYLAQLRAEFYNDIPLANQLKSLAKDIGSRSGYVGQLLTALSLYTIAEERRFFGLPIEEKDIEFSYLTTALNYPGITEWFGLESRTDIEMPTINTENLKKSFAWMFSKDQQGRTILGESRNLRELAAIVASVDAIKVLEDTGKLSEAFLYTDGPQAALEKAIENTAERVRIVWNMLPKTRPLTTSHYSLVDSLFQDIRDIRKYIQDKLEDE